MFVIIGLIVAMAGVLVGYLMEGGSIGTLLHPLPAEGTILVGAAVGSFIASNPLTVIKACIAGVMASLKGSPYTRDVYMECLMMQYEIYVNIKKGGLLALEQDVMDPHSSSIFTKYPKVLHDHHALEFYMDSLKLMINGSAKMDEIDVVMDNDLDVHHHESAAPGAAIGEMGDSFPAFGIVACVCGVIITMGFLDQPPNVIGGKVGAALVGTMMGIFLAYGIVKPIGKAVDAVNASAAYYYNCLKAGLVAFGNGAAPVTAVELARRQVPNHVRPKSGELEEVVRQIKPR